MIIAHIEDGYAYSEGIDLKCLCEVVGLKGEDNLVNFNLDRTADDGGVRELARFREAVTSLTLLKW